MNRQKYACLIMVFLIPILYPLCWWPMRFTGWVFWNEPNEIVKHIWTQTVFTFNQTDILKKREWIYIFIVSMATCIPYLIIWEIIRCVWIIHFN